MLSKKHILENNPAEGKMCLCIIGLWQKLEAQVGEKSNDCRKTSYFLSSFQVLGTKPDIFHSSLHLLTSVWILYRRKPTQVHLGCLKS